MRWWGCWRWAGRRYWYGSRTGAAKPAAAAPVAGGGAQKGGPGGTAGAPAQAIAVEATKVAVMPMPQTITAVGSVRSDESVTLRPEVTGRIAEIRFREGQHVTKGTLLVKMDDSVTGADAEQARANLWLAKAKAERAAELHQKGFVSAQAKDEAEGGLRVAKATVQSAEARLAKMEIKAPFAGIIGLRQVSIGDYVKDGQDMVNLESIEQLKVDFKVPEIFLRQIQVGQSLQLALDAIPGKTYDGRVLAINPLVDAAGRTIVIRAVIRNTNAALRPGMFARVRLLTDEKADSMVIPEQALVPQGEDQFVFKVVDGRAQRAKVEIGQRREGKVEILRGLDPADLVVTAGHLKIRDGTAVRIAAGAGAGAAVAQGARGASPEVAQAEPAGSRNADPTRPARPVKQ
ncbi:MAG: efflux RND transporter periplasmic adaptor subunit [Betaproteobacteria bacterium]|nr:efflux RND transporter periplasmic adaptor subunit [Betaproteobacteria bacterium]